MIDHNLTQRSGWNKNYVLESKYKRVPKKKSEEMPLDRKQILYARDDWKFIFNESDSDRWSLLKINKIRRNYNMVK